MNGMRQAGWLVDNPITVNNFAVLFNYTSAMFCLFDQAHRGSTVGFLLLQRFSVGLVLSTHLVSSQ